VKTMKRLKVHVLYEYGVDMRPNASGYLRLIRPLSYPSIREKVKVTFGRDMPQDNPDLVLVDRLWRPDIRPQIVDELAADIHQRMAKLIYCFDDNFLEVGSREKTIRSIQKQCFETFLEKSDGLIVTTPVLRDLFQTNKSGAVIVPNMLDERLIVKKSLLYRNFPKIVIGYMGTGTHDQDLAIVVPALHALNKMYPGRLLFQFIGIVDEQRRKNWRELDGLPIEIIHPHPVEAEYPAFMVWFTGCTNWDIAIAPLTDDKFNSCKSDVKFLDYAAAGAPGIYSSVTAYSSTVQNGKTGILVDNTPEAWITALCNLIDHENLRHELVRNASSYLFQERCLCSRADDWLQKLYGFA